MKYSVFNTIPIREQHKLKYENALTTDELLSVAANRHTPRELAIKALFQYRIKYHLQKILTNKNQ
jgi:hypothetical protein